MICADYLRVFACGLAKALFLSVGSIPFGWMACCLVWQGFEAQNVSTDSHSCLDLKLIVQVLSEFVDFQAHCVNTHITACFEGLYVNKYAHNSRNCLIGEHMCVYEVYKACV